MKTKQFGPPKRKNPPHAGARLGQRIRGGEEPKRNGADGYAVRVSSEKRLMKSVVEQGFSAVLMTGPNLPDPPIVFMNPAFVEATGFKPAGIIGQPLSALVELGVVNSVLPKSLSSGRRFVEEIAVYRTSSGEERWGEWRIGPARDESGNIINWVIIFRDITERRRLEKEILEISDRERQRLGQDLHDGLCQQLAGIELMSRVLEQRLSTLSKREAAQAGDIARAVRETIVQTRLLARGLSPVAPDAEGLMSSLRELAANATKLFRIQCSLQCDEMVLVRDQAVSTHLFRIAQEAVTNGIKHGHAKRLAIKLGCEGSTVVLQVSDDGSGYDGAPSLSGMGLRIMHYRANSIGAALSVARLPKRGTRVHCVWPGPARGPLTDTSNRKVG